VITNTGATGTLVPFPQSKTSYSISGTWSVSANGTSITVPITGTYLVTYNIYIIWGNTLGSTYVQVSSCLRRNGVIISGLGASAKSRAQYIYPLVATLIIQLNANDILQVYVLASSTGTAITGSDSLFTGDDTSTSFTINRLM
jgi:hypothetical protein